MTWSEYQPLTPTPRLRFTDEFDLLMGDSIGKVEDDGSYTSYHIANITPDELQATLFNYSSEDFETISKDELRTWRKNDTPIDAVLSIHQFTITAADGTQVGLKMHGSAMQSKETIKFLGRGSFSYCLRVAIQDGTKGYEITEPYYADETTRDDDYYAFESTVRNDIQAYLVEETPLTEEQVTTLLNEVLETLEHNAEHRVGVSEGWELPNALRSRRSTTTMDGKPDELIRNNSTDFERISTTQTSIKYHPLS